jgi:hypothetical protein
VAWYTKGFSLGSQVRQKLAVAGSLEEMAALLSDVDADEPWPQGADGPRGRKHSRNKVVLPDGWLDDPFECGSGVGADAELDTSGG